MRLLLTLYYFKQLLDEVSVSIRNNQGRGKCYQPKLKAVSPSL